MISVPVTRKDAVFLGGIFFLLFGVAFNPLASVFSVYDAQRFVQLSFLVFFILCHNIYWPRGGLGIAFVLFFFLGLISSFGAERIEWSLIEVIKFLGLFVFAFLIGSRSNGEKSKVVSVIFVFSTVYLFRILVGLFVVLSAGHGVEVLADGFTNHRHFTEFLTGLFTFCAFFLLISSRLRWSAISLLALVWFVIFFGGARASGIAATISSILFCIINFGTLRGRVATILIPFFIGLLANYFLIGGLLNEEVGSIARATSSGRSELWSHGIGLWLENPFWGVGPMHFAYLSPGLSAHPHNVLIQVLSEWGGFAFLSLGFAFFAYIIRGRKYWSVDSPIQAASLISLAGLSVNAFFGSVFLVPAVEILFFLLLGLGFSSDEISRKEGITSRLFSVCILMIFVVCLVGTYNERTSDEPRGASNGAPRFWQNGGIVLE